MRFSFSGTGRGRCTARAKTAQEDAAAKETAAKKVTDKAAREAADAAGEAATAQLRAWRNLDRAEADAHVEAVIPEAFETEDTKEGLAAFLEKRPPRWKGR